MLAKKMPQDSNYHAPAHWAAHLTKQDKQQTLQQQTLLGKFRVVINSEGNVKIGVAKTLLLRCLNTYWALPIKNISSAE